MKLTKLAFAAAALIAFAAVSGQAHAADCNKDLAALAAAVKGAKLDDAGKAKVTALEADAAAKCKAGDQAGAAKSIGEANAMLGMKK